MQHQTDDILAKISSTLKQHAPDAEAILYGSRARGDARPDSDWDVLVLLDKPEEDTTDYARVAYPLYNLGLDLNENISVNLYTKRDWKRRSFTPFYKNVQEEGIVL
jgi:predicted nucleotidyltransferase